MKQTLMKNKRGQLALDVVEEVSMKILIIAVLGVAVILALVTLNTGVGTLVDTSYTSTATAVVNETGININHTGHTLSGWNSSWNTPTLTAVWNDSNPTGVYNVSVPLAYVKINSTGQVLNASTPANMSLASVSYYYTFSYNNGRTSAITNNVSNGLTGFFGNAGTIFNILIAVVLISAVAIIILVVRRFAGKQVSA
jgi:hypothetical protein